ncbi:MAG TPA: class I SAM-dependent methyltransferase [Chitinophagaceae bacterium]
MAKDLFSKQAAGYSKWRPGYPASLIEYIVSFVNHRKIAWDCATGNGQAAVLLAEYFDQVFATDLSESQLNYAKPHPRIIYSQSPAEHTLFSENTFDLVTVAQAYHWLDHEAFCKEVRRVCKSGAVAAVWGYGLCKSSRTDINDRFNAFYKDVTGPYWDPARHYVDEEYRTVRFDFEEIPVQKTFSIQAIWTIRDLEGYLGSWSAVQNFIKINGYDPVAVFIEELSSHWSEDEPLPFEFPLFMRLGRVF